MRAAPGAMAASSDDSQGIEQRRSTGDDYAARGAMIHHVRTTISCGRFVAASAATQATFSHLVRCNTDQFGAAAMTSALYDGLCKHGPLQGQWFSTSSNNVVASGGHYEWRAYWRIWEWVPSAETSLQLQLFSDEVIRLPGAEIHMHAQTRVNGVRAASAA